MRARRRRPERHAARFLVTALLSAVLLLTLLLTAFGTWTAAPVASQPMASAGVLPGGQPLPQIVAMVGSVQIQLPVAQSAVTALGYHHAGDGSLALDPVGRQGERRPLRAALAPARRHATRGSSGTSSAATAVPARRRSTSVPRRAPTSTRRSTARSSGSPTSCSRTATYGARIDIRPQSAPSLVVSVTHLRADPSLTVGSAVARRLRRSASSST